MITATAQAAILDSGLPGLMTLGGGSLQVRLINGSSEASGGGYARQRFSEWELASNSGSQSLKSSIAVNFAASGGAIEYDRVEVYNRAGTTRYLRSDYLGAQSIADGVTREVRVTFGTPQPTPYFWDFTTLGQLTRITGRRPTYGLDIPGAVPWLLPDGSVYARDLIFRPAFKFQGASFADHEPEVVATYSTGTIGIVNGVVTGSGTSFPAYGTNALYFRQLHVNGVIYQVGNGSVTGTSMTLVNTSVNVAPGTAYKYAPWDFREIDPKYATNDAEWQGAQDELLYAMNDSDDVVQQYGSHPGVYEYGIPPIYRRTNDIIDDANAGLYEEWLANLDATSSYVTSSGVTMVEWVRERGGYFVWTSYVPHAYIGSEINWTRWRLRNERIYNALAERNIPNIMLLLRHTQDTGYGQFLANTAAEEVPRAFQTLLIQDAHDREPGSWGFWGITNSAGKPQYRLSTSDDYIAYIEDTVADLVF